jgi:hypothetical protein
MKITNAAKYALGVAAAAALLAGCSSNGTGSQFAPSTGSGQTSMAKRPVTAKLLQEVSVLNPKAIQRLGQQHTGYKPVRMVKPNCCAYAKTSFITDTEGGPSYTGAAYMFDFKTGDLLGQLASPPEGFFEPQGACSDKSGNVWITNTVEQSVDQYSHDGTYIQTLADPNGFPVGCAVNKKTGDLAVTNILNASEGTPGNLVVYTGATGSGTEYSVTGAGMLRPFFIGYTPTGVAYFSGENDSYGFTAATFSGGTVSGVTLSGAPIEFPGTVAWSGKTKTINFGDQDTSTFYQIDPTTNTSTGTTTLACSYCDIVQATIKGPTLVGPNAAGGSVSNYNWPAGSAGVTYSGASFIQALGSAVSPDVPE